MTAPHALHPSDQTLSSYGLGKLDEAAAEAVNQHLESCPACRRRSPNGNMPAGRTARRSTRSGIIRGAWSRMAGTAITRVARLGPYIPAVKPTAGPSRPANALPYLSEVSRSDGATPSREGRLRVRIGAAAGWRG
jgi:hypothetical protein